MGQSHQEFRMGGAVRPPLGLSAREYHGDHRGGGAMAMEQPKPSGAGEAWASRDAASSWQSRAAARGQALAPVDQLMLDLAGVTLGSRVLDLGAGTGGRPAQRPDAGNGCSAPRIGVGL